MLHLIPESSSHWHILISVFPSVGLIFLLGLYVTALIANNEVMKRTSLAFFVLFALLAVPTYVSGDGSMDLLSQNPKIPQAEQDQMSLHYGWAVTALGVLVLTGIAAFVALVRSIGFGRASNESLHLVLGLAIITLALMVLVGEMGWEISHRELQLPTLIGVGTPQIWSHIHMILNHFPTVGFTIALVFYVVALVSGDVVTTRSSLVLFVICGAIIVPTYVTGAASMWALTVPPIAEISKALINEHRDMALATLFSLAFTGGAAWLELWRYRYTGRYSNVSLYIVLAFALVTLAVMAETGHRGGQINHPEIRAAAEALPSDPDAGFLSPYLEKAINQVIWFVPWQTVHFFGYSMIFGTVLAVVLRVLGFWKSVSFAAVHRVLPIGFFGVLMNVFTGMLMMMADTYRYVVTDTTFAPKMALIPIGVMAILYFSVAEGVWKVKAGEDAPIGAKWVAALVLLAWTGVIMGGRLLPYV
jgi:uncharacterized membrane protein